MNSRQVFTFGGLLSLGALTLVFVFQGHRGSFSENAESLIEPTPMQDSSEHPARVPSDAESSLRTTMKKSTETSMEDKLDSVPRPMPRLVSSSKTLPGRPNMKQLRPVQLTSLDSKWLWWTHATAVHKENARPSSEVLAEVDQHLVFSSNELASSPDRFYSDKPLVLYDPHRQRVGLLTGVFVVTTRDEPSLASFENDSDYDIVNTQAHLHRIYLRPKKNPYSLAEVSGVLSHDERVREFEYEILRGNLIRN